MEAFIIGYTAYNQKHEEIWRNCTLEDAKAIIREVCNTSKILYAIPVNLKHSNWRQLPARLRKLWVNKPAIKQFYKTL